MFISAIQIHFDSDGCPHLGQLSQFIRKDTIERLYFCDELERIVGVVGDKIYALKSLTCDFNQAWDNLIPVDEIN